MVRIPSRVKTNKTPRIRTQAQLKAWRNLQGVLNVVRAPVTEYTPTQAPKLESGRIPDLLANLKTVAGGNRWRGLFDSRVLELWKLLAGHANAGSDYTVTVTVTEYAERLGVHRHTVQRWLRFFERNHLLTVTQRRGGRGRGLRVVMVWVKIGDEHAARRRKRELERQQRMNANRDQDSVSSNTVPQRLSSLSTTLRVDGHPHHDDHVRGPGHARFVLFSLRQAVKGTDLNKPQRETLMAQFSKWVWRKTLSLSQLRRVHGWLLDQAGKVIAFQGRALIQWLVRGLHRLVTWARSRSNTRATRRTVAELEHEDRAAAAVTVDDELYAEQLAEIRAALKADGWMMPG